jgi:NAD-dependent SIR2 family protein deacetylase
MVKNTVQLMTGGMVHVTNLTPGRDNPANRYSTIEAFREDPATCWSLHRVMITQMAQLLPNAGHAAIARLQDMGDDEFEEDEAGGRTSVGDEAGRLRVCVVTQNIDGMHQAAGSRPVGKYKLN